MRTSKTRLLTIILLLIFVISVFYINSCDSGPTEPEVKPGRRDYVWEVDTLKPPEGRSLPFVMWGENANDVWAVGLSYLNAYCIWHFDGVTWKNYEPDKFILPRGIWGTDRNNIWICCSNGAFWNFNGGRWKEVSTLKIDGYYDLDFQKIVGYNKNNIYAVGFADSIDNYSYKAIIAKYDGKNWSLVNIPKIQESFWQIYYDKTSGKFLINSLNFDTPEGKIYSFDGTNLNVVHTFQNTWSLCNVNREVYFQEEQKLYKYSSNKFDLFKDFGGTEYIGNAIGTNEKNIFTVNGDGIGHYNGENLTTIFKKKNQEWTPSGAIVFESDLFFIYDDLDYTYIVHGKLK